MRPELEEIQLLEHYLSGRLGEEQEQELEIRLLWDQEWQQQVAQQQLAYRAIREAGRQQLRHELQVIHQKLFG
jgi:signal-transduction protein with cAMP-binding, CBS, and nucleotidyltransferase domain